MGKVDAELHDLSPPGWVRGKVAGWGGGVQRPAYAARLAPAGSGTLARPPTIDSFAGYTARQPESRTALVTGNHGHPVAATRDHVRPLTEITMNRKKGLTKCPKIA
jgi:hypothetical protein